MNTLQQMDFFWSKHNEDNLSWKECLKALDITASDFQHFGFSIKVNTEKFIDFTLQRDWMVTHPASSGTVAIMAGTRTERSVYTLFAPFCLDGKEAELVEWDFNESPERLPDDELRDMLRESTMEQDGSISDTLVFFEGFFDSVVFRSIAEDFFEIKFPPFSEWTLASMERRRFD